MCHFNVFFSLEEKESEKINDKLVDNMIEELRLELEENDVNEFSSLVEFYCKSFTLKQLLKIADYYEITHLLKKSEKNKKKVSQLISDFESEPENIDIVKERLINCFK